MDDRLYRSRDDRVLAGVCGGLADRLRLDPSLVRIGWVLLTIISGGIFLVLYIVMAIVVPEAPALGWQPGPQPPPGPGAVPGWNPPAPTTASPGVAPATAASGVALAATDPGSPQAADAAPDETTTATSPEPILGAPQPPPQLGEPPQERERRGSGAVLVIGLGFILVGAWLFLRPYLPDWFDWQTIWPAMVIAFGIFLVFAAFRPGGSQRG